MELPTYTNIWKIEKRLYKLYDFRLPMPLPVGQVAAFLAIAIPYMLILTMAGMPFSHTWVWLYVLPPGVLAWLVTRPVLEGKRLPELVLSQLRYLSEPRTWCRMAPLAEKDQMFVTARVWRRPAATSLTAMAARTAMARPRWHAPAMAAPAAPAMAATAFAAGGVEDSGGVTADARSAADTSEGISPARPVWPTRPAIASAGASPTLAASQRQPARAQPAMRRRHGRSRAQSHAGDTAANFAAGTVAAGNIAAGNIAAGNIAAGDIAGRPVQRKHGSARAGRPPLTVRADNAAVRPLHVVERALRSSHGGGSDAWHDRVVVVPGGHRPGKPDQVQRDLARARMPLPGPARIVVLGCTAGAGQTTTTLLTGQLLASLRGEAVAVLDIGGGPGSLTEQARQIPRLLPGRRDDDRPGGRYLKIGPGTGPSGHHGR